MTMVSKWNTVRNCFNPITPVSGKYLDAWFVSRESSPLKRIEFVLEPGPGKKILLVGQRGSGKTSELFKLISEIQEDYFTVYLDFYASLDLDIASRIELLFCIGAAVYKAAREAMLDLPQDLWNEMVSSISTLIREQIKERKIKIDPVAVLTAIISTAGAVYPPAASVGGMLGQSTTWGFGLGRTETERLEVGPILREVIARVNNIIVEVQRRSGKKVVLIADGLDKITKREQADLIFDRSWILTEIACPAVYTVPLVLYYSTKYNKIDDYFADAVLPNVRLYAKNDRSQKYLKGYETLHALVEKRLVAAGWELHHIFAEAALDLLIEMSGGLMRDMVALVQQSATEAQDMAQDTITLEVAQRAIARQRRTIQAGFFKEHYRALLEAEKAGWIPDDRDEYQMQLLRDGHLVDYENGGFWRDVHPIVLGILDDYKLKIRA